MKTIPYKPHGRMDWGLVGTLKPDSAGVEIADRTREDVARFESHGRRAWWCILWLPLSALAPVGLAIFSRARVAGPGQALVLVLPVMLTFAWFVYNVIKAANCPWCGVRLADQPRMPAPSHCASCAQPLTLRAFDANTPHENAGGCVPR